jgi:hypothetical protein
LDRLDLRGLRELGDLPSDLQILLARRAEQLEDLLWREHAGRGDRRLQLRKCGRRRSATRFAVEDAGLDVPHLDVEGCAVKFPIVVVLSTVIN